MAFRLQYLPNPRLRSLLRCTVSSEVELDFGGVNELTLDLVANEMRV